ncbi:VPS28-2 [Symbiodinium sp. CCMP2592]|nr:VPS28-2 [Symbiodinium sp. CCMP2592]
MFVSDCSQPDPIVLPHSAAHSGTSVLTSATARPGLAVFVPAFHHLGLPLPARSFVCFASSALASGLGCIEPSVLVPDSSHTEPALSIRNFACTGPAAPFFGLGRVDLPLSVFDSSSSGLLLFIRNLFRAGPSLSAFGLGSLDLSSLVLDLTHLESSTLLRSFVRPGLPILPVDFVATGSSMPLRQPSRTGLVVPVSGTARLGSSVLLFDAARVRTLSIYFRCDRIWPTSTDEKLSSLISDGSDSTYLKISSSQLDVYAGTQRGITVTANGGTLHGAWSAEASITTSDRRLKRNIQPLYQTIATRARDRWESDSGAQPAADKLSEGEQVKWLLRELRPVSFQLKRGPEAKYLKFGFIAQELEAVFPNLVRTVGDNTKAVASQDLIAVLTLAFQNLQKEHDEYKKTVLDQQRELETLKRRLDRLEAVGA